MIKIEVHYKTLSVSGLIQWINRGRIIEDMIAIVGVTMHHPHFIAIHFTNFFRFLPNDQGKS